MGWTKYFTSTEDLTIASCEDGVITIFTGGLVFNAAAPSAWRQSFFRQEPNSPEQNPHMTSLGDGIHASIQYLEITGREKLPSFPAWLGRLALLWCLVIGNFSQPDCIARFNAKPYGTQDLTI